MSDLVLALDTSSDAAVALCRVRADKAAEGPVQALGRARSGDQRRHAEALAPMIQGVLRTAGARPDQVDAVVVGTGPAPFTGLRVGLVTARAYARARGITAYGVCSLDALALAATEHPDSGPEVLVVADAKRREVYYARYRRTEGDVTAVIGPDVARPADVAEEHADLVAAGAVYGPALLLYPEFFGLGAQVETAATVTRAEPVDPVQMVRIATHRRIHGGDLSLAPRYLRRPDVHVSPGRKRAT
ncbi:MAG TPA: tRNA (adenosine(37)-N6)-threonylcarbamoyltransferase complex dimerization subunit type 1 TsaB [Beutenbergiaceae bacterium]|nr:tRNA (adenosine(37)-N6)-threonylcarbamoyltransferase complex dimerization subunit type 1 TsaB [Beutenbergiaceae bacterium]